MKSQNIDKLIFFWMLTGKKYMYEKLLDKLKLQGENSKRFLTSLYTGNINDRVELLAETGHCKLKFNLLFLDTLAKITNDIHNANPEQNENISKNLESSNTKINLKDVNNLKLK